MEPEYVPKIVNNIPVLLSMAPENDLDPVLLQEFCPVRFFLLGYLKECQVM
jgi:hypothetical protein